MIATQKSSGLMIATATAALHVTRRHFLIMLDARA
jgi:hypothetical protein